MHGLLRRYLPQQRAARVYDETPPMKRERIMYLAPGLSLLAQTGLPLCDFVSFVVVVPETLVPRRPTKQGADSFWPHEDEIRACPKCRRSTSTWSRRNNNVIVLGRLQGFNHRW